MFQELQTAFFRTVEHLNTAIVTIRGNTYGSLEEAKLARLRIDLQQIVGLLDQRSDSVIIDLTSVSFMGSGFLQQLFHGIRAIGRDPKRILVCGDQTGLLKLCATDRWLTVCQDLEEALIRSGKFKCAALAA